MSRNWIREASTFKHSLKDIPGRFGSFVRSGVSDTNIWRGVLLHTTDCFPNLRLTTASRILHEYSKVYKTSNHQIQALFESSLRNIFSSNDTNKLVQIWIVESTKASDLWRLFHCILLIYPKGLSFSLPFFEDRLQFFHSTGALPNRDIAQFLASQKALLKNYSGVASLNKFLLSAFDFLSLSFPDFLQILDFLYHTHQFPLIRSQLMHQLLSIISPISPISPIQSISPLTTQSHLLGKDFDREKGPPSLQVLRNLNSLPIPTLCDFLSSLWTISLSPRATEEDKRQLASVANIIVQHLISFTASFAQPPSPLPSPLLSSPLLSLASSSELLSMACLLRLMAKGTAETLGERERLPLCALMRTLCKELWRCVEGVEWCERKDQWNHWKILCELYCVNEGLMTLRVRNKRRERIGERGDKIEKRRLYREDKEREHLRQDSSLSFAELREALTNKCFQLLRLLLRSPLSPHEALHALCSVSAFYHPHPEKGKNALGEEREVEERRGEVRSGEERRREERERETRRRNRECEDLIVTLARRVKVEDLHYQDMNNALKGVVGKLQYSPCQNGELYKHFLLPWLAEMGAKISLSPADQESSLQIINLMRLVSICRLEEFAFDRAFRQFFTSQVNREKRVINFSQVCQFLYFIAGRHERSHQSGNATLLSHCIKNKDQANATDLLMLLSYLALADERGEEMNTLIPLLVRLLAGQEDAEACLSAGPGLSEKNSLIDPKLVGEDSKQLLLTALTHFTLSQGVSALPLSTLVTLTQFLDK